MVIVGGWMEGGKKEYVTARQVLCRHTNAHTELPDKKGNMSCNSMHGTESPPIYKSCEVMAKLLEASIVRSWTMEY